MKPSKNLQLEVARATRAGREYSPLLALCEKEFEDAIFLLPGVGGNVLVFQDVIPYLEEKKVFVLMPRGWNGKSRPFEDLESLMKSYVQAVLELGLRGTHHFVGYCFGGILGLELASRLSKLGVSVGLLGVIESNGPRANQRTKTGWISHLRRHLGEASRRGLKNYLLSRAAGRMRTARKKIKIISCHFRMSIGSPIPFDLREEFIASQETEIFRKYKGTHYAGDLVVFWSEKDPEWTWLNGSHRKTRAFCGEKALLNWRTWIQGSTKLIYIPGDHSSILRSPNAEILAKRILEYSSKESPRLA